MKRILLLIALITALGAAAAGAQNEYTPGFEKGTLILNIFEEKGRHYMNVNEAIISYDPKEIVVQGEKGDTIKPKDLVAPFRALARIRFDPKGNEKVVWLKLLEQYQFREGVIYRPGHERPVGIEDMETTERYNSYFR